jgi:hypothetical protein
LERRVALAVSVLYCFDGVWQPMYYIGQECPDAFTIYPICKLDDSLIGKFIDCRVQKLVAAVGQARQEEKADMQKFTGPRRHAFFTFWQPQLIRHRLESCSHYAIQHRVDCAKRSSLGSSYHGYFTIRFSPVRQR